MNERTPAPARGRPRTITRERLADAGIAMGLPNITILGIAAELGVSPKALYKHVSGLEELKRLVAEEIFLRWHLPVPTTGGHEGLENYMVTFSVSMWELVEEYPGIAPYMLREDMITPAMLAKMEAHQSDMARLYCISFAQSRWLFFTVAYFCVAVADTVLPLKVANDVPTPGAARVTRVEAQYALGARALIVGALVVLNEIEDD